MFWAVSMINFTTTSKTSKFVKVLVFGDSGVGKTTLIATAPNPIIISAEAGLLSISDTEIPVIEVNTVDDFDEAYEMVTSEDFSEYETICVDSATEIAEVVLADGKRNNKDGRAAYGHMNDRVLELLKKFRDINDKHVYITCKMARIEDVNSGIAKYKGMMPGKTLVQNLPYLFDEILCLQIAEDDDGESFRYLQTQPSITHDAKDRSGKLDDPEKPDLTHIFEKIVGKSETSNSDKK
jgi:hypothetical protein